MTDVKCKVESCYYWDKGDVCKADTITVDNNTTATGRMEAADLTVGSVTRGRARDFEAGDLTTGTQGDRTGVLARTSHETLCSTFRPKNAGPTR